jgi:hypothetical protein
MTQLDNTNSYNIEARIIKIPISPMIVCEWYHKGKLVERLIAK